jgi:hypothetical protein
VGKRSKIRSISASGETRSSSGYMSRSSWKPTLVTPLSNGMIQIQPPGKQWCIVPPLRWKRNIGLGPPSTASSSGTPLKWAKIERVFVRRRAGSSRRPNLLARKDACPVASTTMRARTSRSPSGPRTARVTPPSPGRKSTSSVCST